MDFELSEEQRLYQDSARKMVTLHIEPELKSHDRGNRPLPKEAMLRIFQAFAREGLRNSAFQRRTVDRGCRDAGLWTGIRAGAINAR